MEFFHLKKDVGQHWTLATHFNLLLIEIENHSNETLKKGKNDLDLVREELAEVKLQVDEKDFQIQRLKSELKQEKVLFKFYTYYSGKINKWHT